MSKMLEEEEARAEHCVVHQLYGESRRGESCSKWKEWATSQEKRWKENPRLSLGGWWG